MQDMTRKEAIENKLNKLERICQKNIDEGNLERYNYLQSMLKGMLDVLKMLGYRVDRNINDEGYDTYTIID